MGKSDINPMEIMDPKLHGAGVGEKLPARTGLIPSENWMS